MADKKHTRRISPFSWGPQYKRDWERELLCSKESSHGKPQELSQTWPICFFFFHHFETQFDRMHWSDHMLVQFLPAADNPHWFKDRPPRAIKVGPTLSLWPIILIPWDEQLFFFWTILPQSQKWSRCWLLWIFTTTLLFCNMKSH